MDHHLIQKQNGLFNLEIDSTQHPHSSSSSQTQKEDELKRNWADLPSDVLSLIFKKLGAVNILTTAQWVCTSWWKLSKQPHLFCSIHVNEFATIFDCRTPLYTSYECYRRSKRLAIEAIDRSCGELVEFSVREIADDDLLHYLSAKSGSLRCISLASCFEVTADGLIEMAEKLPQLEDFEIFNFKYMTIDVIETYGRLCPRLKSCRLNCVNYYDSEIGSVVGVIAQNMPELRTLHLFASRISDDGLKAVLDGCPHLESLDLRQCFDLKFEGDLKVRCGNIKVLRLPNDPTDDFEYEILPCPTYDFFGYDYDHSYYSVHDEYYGSDDYDGYRSDGYY